MSFFPGRDEQLCLRRAPKAAEMNLLGEFG